jgi:hypothetical protein
MSNSPGSLVEAASAVATLGVCQGDIDLLDEASLVAGMGFLRELDRQSQTYKLWFAAAIARQSDHTLGYDGLARRNGSAERVGDTGDFHSVGDGVLDRGGNEAGAAGAGDGRCRDCTGRVGAGWDGPGWVGVAGG